MLMDTEAILTAVQGKIIERQANTAEAACIIDGALAVLDAERDIIAHTVTTVRPPSYTTEAPNGDRPAIATTGGIERETDHHQYDEAAREQAPPIPEDAPPVRDDGLDIGDEDPGDERGRYCRDCESWFSVGEQCPHSEDAMPTDDDKTQPLDSGHRTP